MRKAQSTKVIIFKSICLQELEEAHNYSGATRPNQKGNFSIKYTTQVVQVLFRQPDRKQKKRKKNGMLRVN
jgi:hypothetical protein